jgi:hypothetical protein
VRRAQQQLAPLVQDAMQATVGSENLLVDNVVSGYRERFGDNPDRRSPAPDPMVLGVGVIEDDNPPPRPRRQPRATPPDDEEYFADRDYLR